MPPVDRESLPYRSCAGAMVLNHRGEVWLGKRNKANELTGDQTLWQMPQGGIDEGEDPSKAALRELYEETSIRSVELIRMSSKLFVYDLPDNLVGVSWKGKYRGQKLAWALCRFTGDEAEINVKSPANGKHKAEFENWQWCPLDDMLPLVVPFKREMYVEVFEHFSHDIAEYQSAINTKTRQDNQPGALKRLVKRFF